jgi:hypothetical protein
VLAGVSALERRVALGLVLGDLVDGARRERPGDAQDRARAGAR